jgi:hypothetical protein
MSDPLGLPSLDSRSGDGLDAVAGAGVSPRQAPSEARPRPASCCSAADPLTTRGHRSRCRAHAPAPAAVTPKNVLTHQPDAHLHQAIAIARSGASATDWRDRVGGKRKLAPALAECWIVADAILRSPPAATRKQSSSWRARSSQRCAPHRLRRDFSRPADSTCLPSLSMLRWERPTGGWQETIPVSGRSERAPPRARLCRRVCR